MCGARLVLDRVLAIRGHCEALSLSFSTLEAWRSVFQLVFSKSSNPCVCRRFERPCVCRRFERFLIESEECRRFDRDCDLLQTLPVDDFFAEVVNVGSGGG